MLRRKGIRSHRIAGAGLTLALTLLASVCLARASAHDDCVERQGARFVVEAYLIDERATLVLPWSGAPCSLEVIESPPKQGLTATRLHTQKRAGETTSWSEPLEIRIFDHLGLLSRQPAPRRDPEANDIRPYERAIPQPAVLVFVIATALGCLLAAVLGAKAWCSMTAGCAALVCMPNCWPPKTLLGAVAQTKPAHSCERTFSKTHKSPNRGLK